LAATNDKSNVNPTRSLKRFMNKAFRYSGLKASYFKFISRDNGGVKCPILLYHSIGDDDVPQKLLSEHIGLLSSTFSIIPLNSLYQAIIDDNLPKNPLVITFDDGYRSNLELALPILQEYKVSSTIFIATGYAGGEFIGKPMLTAMQIKGLSNSGVEIGCHSVTHPDLRQLSLTSLRSELTSSKAILEDITGAEVISLAYPYGKYNAQVIETTREAGFKIAVTTVHDFTVMPNRLFECPRILVYPYDTCDDLWAKINGDQHWLKMAHKLFVR